MGLLVGATLLLGLGCSGFSRSTMRGQLLAGIGDGDLAGVALGLELFGSPTWRHRGALTDRVSVQHEESTETSLEPLGGGAHPEA